MSYAKNVINGKYGEVWIDDEKVAECFGLSAKVELQREDVKICGERFTQTKLIGAKGKGTLKLNKVTTRFAKKISDILATGKDARFEIVSKLADPDALGHERVVIKDVCFGDLTLADWEDAKTGTVEAPFTFGGYEYMDTIDATLL